MSTKISEVLNFICNHLLYPQNPLYLRSQIKIEPVIFFTIFLRREFMRPLPILLRKHILSVKAYSSARSEYPTGSVKAAPNLAVQTFLDANENAFGSPNGLAFNGVAVNRYPDPLQTALKRRIADVKHLPPDRTNTIFLGNGSDEPIDLILRAFCEPSVYNTSGEVVLGDEIIITPPTYGMYEVSAAIHNIMVCRVPLVRSLDEESGSYSLDVEGVLQAISPRTKVIFLCSPNNPTANVFEREALERIIRGFEGIVVLDEAYIDFAPKHSFLPRLQDFPNLIILQTFSKAWGMAALRLGMAFADEAIISVLNTIKPPYNINVLTQETAMTALYHGEWHDRVVSETIRERERLVAELECVRLVQRVFPSDANFILVQFENARSIYEALVQRHIVVRDRSGVALCDDCLRITVGTAEENKRLLGALSEIADER